MSMLSTRGAAAVSESMAILRGLAPDAGELGKLVGQFGDGTDVAGFEFRYFNGFFASKNIETVHLLFCFTFIVINHGIRFQFTGAYLN